MGPKGPTDDTKGCSSLQELEKARVKAIHEAGMVQVSPWGWLRGSSQGSLAPAFSTGTVLPRRLLQSLRGSLAPGLSAGLARSAALYRYRLLCGSLQDSPAKRLSTGLPRSAALREDCSLQGLPTLRLPIELSR